MAVQADHKAEETTKTPANTNLAAWQGLIEQRIQDGLSQGVFDNLPGMGKPLNLWDDAFVPEEMRMGFRLLRSNGLAPLWVEVNREIQEDIARMHRVRDHARERWHRITAIERSNLRQEYARRVQQINDKILKHNILAPSSYVHMALLLAHEELAAFDTAVAEATRSEQP